MRSPVLPSTREQDTHPVPHPGPTAPDSDHDGLAIGSLCTGYAGLDMGAAAALGGARLAWVAETALGLSRRAQLQALGNGVIPQQAERAFVHLLADHVGGEV